MKFAEAAEIVLSQAGKPLHFREITERAIELQLIEADGKTPWNSMNGTLRRLIRQKGDELPIVSLGDGLFALRAWGVVPRPLPGPGTPALQASTTTLRTSGTYRVQIESPQRLFPADYKWRAIIREARERLHQQPRLPLYQQAQRGLVGLLVWGLASLLNGLALLTGGRSAFAEGLAGQLVLWGAAHSVLALRAMDGIARQDMEAAAAAKAMAAANKESLETQKVWYRQVLLAGTLLGLLTMLFGLTMHNCQEEEPRRRGMGLGLLTQGSFCLVASLFNLWLASGQDTND